jgi:transglutaminase-like putative cysteine protease
MKLTIAHEFLYRYDSPVRLSTQYLRLVPRDTARQKVLHWRIDTPEPALRTTDGYGNVLHVLTLDKPTEEIEIHASGVVQTSAALDEPCDFTGVPLPPLVFLRPSSLTPMNAALRSLAEGFRGKGATAGGLGKLAAAIRRGNAGSAADAVHAFIACCRHLGVPARYVSGYRYFTQRSGAGAALHAWAEAWIDERWHSFDIAYDEPVGEAHIKIAVGADYLDACPVRGVRIGGGGETLQAEAHVEASQQ